MLDEIGGGGYLRRTGVFLSLGVIIGAASNSARFLWILLFAFLATGIGVIFKKVSLKLAVVFLFLIVLGFANTSARQIESLPVGPGSWIVEVQNDSYQTSSDYFRGTAVIKNDGRRAVLYSKVPWKSNTVLSVRGEVAFPLTANNPGEYDYALSLERQGIAGVIFVDTQQLISQNRVTPLMKLRKHLSINLAKLPESLRGIAEALVLGLKTNITFQQKEMWRKAGASHILAVSGLHISIISGAIYLLCRKAFGYKVSWIMAAIFGVSYAAVVGSSLSAWRAALFLVILCIANVSLREPDWLTTFFVVGALMLLVSPSAIYDPGFQLSFLSTAGLLYLTKPLQTILRLHGKIGLLVAASLAAQLGSLPAVINIFSAVPLYGVVASVLLIPLATILIAGSFLVASLGSISFIAMAINSVYIVFVTFYVSLVRVFSQLPLASLNVRAFSATCVGLYYLWLLLLPSERKSTLVVRRIVIAVLLILLIAPNVNNHELHITFLSVGNADAIHIRHAGKHYLIDTATAEAASRSLIPYLRSEGVNSLWGIFLSHSHADHAGGLTELLSTYSEAKVFSGPELAEVLQQMEKNTVLHPLGSGFSVTRGQLNIRAIAAEDTALSVNSRSAVLIMTKNNFSALFTGDIELHGEVLLSSQMADCDILKVAHHGSNTSSSESFLASVSPEVAVISVGANRYGHPSSKVIERLEQSGALVFRTDQGGAIRIIVGKDNYRIYQFRERRWQYVVTCPLSGTSKGP
ncbi:MAG: DNA internalization-related competence protein ComEC/Rec2 [bacterium]|nr:DNA internalization-related competence protein ComEC/Rec2 [bacterium]